MILPVSSIEDIEASTKKVDRLIMEYKDKIAPVSDETIGIGEEIYKKNVEEDSPKNGSSSVSVESMEDIKKTKYKVKRKKSRRKNLYVETKDSFSGAKRNTLKKIIDN